ncbi:polysaccharide deacetylase family protein [Pyxidicoccus sp. MSG2]|uniref:polysaccharide deacetylase family protein n=1 Tax=Pyxidicoccus sp. MSG2 TaxID=2996790 RepID=UPI00226D8A43|nr:polysaccharide deacetylase family protein [Pyxidicoccus sp. MSG2]MCY1020568.1 polysaccharide deacetylase family protein [Pyxidicoccus sp. MSG2]
MKTPTRRRALSRALAACCLLVVVLAASPAQGLPRLPPVAAVTLSQATPPLDLEPGQVVVTFTFADTLKTQVLVGPLFAKYGMHATFYISAGRIGRSGYLTLADLRALAAAGHEIGGHTLDHEDLDPLPLAEQRHQVCDCRVALMGYGFPVTSFAYPFGSEGATAKQTVIFCNYNNARHTGRIRSPTGCNSCPLAESVPPADAFSIRSPTSIKSDWTLANLQSLVLQAENGGGGWIMISLHDICSGCGTYAITESLLDSFLAWLAPRVSRGTFVRTAHEVVGGAVKPPIRADGGVVDGGVPDAGVLDAGSPDAGTPDAGTPDAGTPDAGIPDAGVPDGGSPDGGGPQLLPNPSLEVDADGDNVPDCWKRTNAGTQSGSWSRTTDAHSGSWAQRVTLTSLSTGGERRLEIRQDFGTCPPSVVVGRRYRVSAWYKTTARAGFRAFYRTASGWVAWSAGPDLPTSTSYRQGEWLTPPVPSGAVAISVALALRSTGTLTMDDFSLVDAGTSPTSTLTVLSPRGGESLSEGAPMGLRWSDTGSEATVDLAWSPDLGSTWTPIASGVPNTGRYTWRVPGMLTTRGLLRVSHPAASGMSAQSQGPFSIFLPALGRVVRFGDVWRYDASGVDPGPDWFLPAFDDSAWATGPGELGYGDGDEGTVLLRTFSAQPSIYFRKKVMLARPISSATLRVRFDDGVAVWVNGTLVFSREVDGGLAHTAYASASLDNAVVDVALPASVFVAGENTAAVMVKQVGPNSPDVSFDLQLDTVAAPAAE